MGRHRRDALRAIGISGEEIEKLLTEDAWNISNNFCVFGEDYEATMRQSFSQYANYERQARDLLGSSKPIVARAAATMLVNADRLEGDQGWDYFRQLAESIQGAIT